MATPVESLLAIRKEDFDFLIQHCCTCSCLNSKEKVTVEDIQAAVYPKGWSVQTFKTPQKRKNRQSRVKTADDFMRCVNQWRLTQLMIVTNREKYESMVRAFTLSPTITSEGHNSQRLTAENLVELGTHLARLVERSINAHMAQKSFTHFQSLIFLSYCLYLTKKGTPSEKIDNLLKVFNKDEKKRKRLLVQAAQINKMIAELGNKGWNIVRATELFLICPFSGYDLLNLSLEDFGDIMSSVSDAKPNFTGCLMPSYHNTTPTSSFLE
ncbi:hypothetical protein J3E72DRAFT_382433 [Bipolaris maydis]|nr:hypothetical protein J3E72DRAFT_382433 [Bipolaris maydis]